MKISVIMPVYNAEEYVGIALDSLLEQSFKDMEIICVDDGSTDRSLEILHRYQEKDERITVLQQENKYAGVARNLGMSVAQGEYLAFLDADDYFRPDMLQKAYECAEEENADIVVYGGEKFRGDISNLEPFPALLRENLLPPSTKNGFENETKMENIMNFTNPAPWNKLFRRDFILKQNLQFQNYKRFNDAYFVVMALVLAKKIGIVHENLIYYRTGNGNSLQGSNDEVPAQFADVFSDIQNKLIELDLYEQVEKSFRKISLSTCIYALESLANVDSFEKLYLKLQGELFAKFHIIGSARSDYYNTYAYDQYLYICSHTPMEYLMDKAKNKVEQETQYLFPYSEIEKNSRIMIYGAGKVGRAFYQQIKKTQYCHIEAWVDKKERMYDGCTIYRPEEADWEKCEKIVIAIEKESIAKDIENTLIDEYHVAKRKIIWESPAL